MTIVLLEVGLVTAIVEEFVIPAHVTAAVHAGLMMKPITAL